MTQAGVEISTLSVKAWPAKARNASRMIRRSDGRSRRVRTITHAANSAISRASPIAAAFDLDAQVFVVGGPGVQDLGDPAVGWDHHVAGADAPAEPGRFRRGSLEAGPQQAASAQVAGFVHEDVEQPDLVQVARQQRQHRQQRGAASNSSSRSRAAKTLERMVIRLRPVTATA